MWGCAVKPGHAPVLDLIEAIEGRDITVYLSRAHERRLQANIARFNEDVPEDPMDPNEDADLAVALVATSDRGLREGESDAGVWTDPAGREHSLPRRVRSRWDRRLRFAWRSAVTTWRAT